MVNKVTSNIFIPLTPVVQSLPPALEKSSQIEMIGKKELLKLRYAQSSMKDETRDGLPIEQLEENMRTDGYNKKHPIRVVLMSPDRLDSPQKKKIALDTRRTHAAREVARAEEDFKAAIILKESREPADEEYDQMRHLTFENKSVPDDIRQSNISSWNRWHEPERLKRAKIIPKSWGHLVKLRMAMSSFPGDSLRANEANGFISSPHMRKSFQRTSLNKRKLEFEDEKKDVKKPRVSKD